jgi:hypothetical protein
MMLLQKTSMTSLFASLGSPKMKANSAQRKIRQCRYALKARLVKKRRQPVIGGVTGATGLVAAKSGVLDSGGGRSCRTATCLCLCVSDCVLSFFKTGD